MSRVPRPEPKARMDAYEAVFAALAHPARRRIGGEAQEAVGG
jgi:hypothetical protein